MTTVIAGTDTQSTFGFKKEIVIHSGGYKEGGRNIQIPYIHPDKFEIKVEFIEEDRFLITLTGQLPIIIYDQNSIQGTLATLILGHGDSQVTKNQEDVYLSCPVFSQMGKPKLLTMRIKTWMSTTGPCLTIYPKIT